MPHSGARSIAATLPPDVLVSAFVERIGDDLLTVGDVSASLDRTPERVGQLIRRDDLRATRISLSGRGAYIILAADVAAFQGSLAEFLLNEVSSADYRTWERE